MEYDLPIIYISESYTSHYVYNDVQTSIHMFQDTKELRCGGQYLSQGGKMRKRETLKMGGIRRREFVEYFLRIADETDGQETFMGCGWEVIISPETWSIYGSIKICRVSITFHIEEDKFEKFVSKFRLSFLRGGG